MTLRHFLPAVLAALLCCAGPLHADPASDAQKGIQAAYDRRDAALAHFDIEGYLSVYSRDYRSMDDATHRASIDRKRQQLISALQRAPHIVRTETVQSILMYGPDAVVTVQTTSTGHGKTQTGMGRAFWVHTPSGWRMKQERTLGGSLL